MTGRLRVVGGWVGGLDHRNTCTGSGPLSVDVCGTQADAAVQ